MLFRLDPGSPLPLGDQIAGCVRQAIADGEVRGGERLPPARQLAESLDVNVHTVLRGYQRLREEGLIDLRRGRGAVVTDARPAGRARLLQQIRELVTLSQSLGLSGEEVLTLVRASLGPEGGDRAGAG
ncbi:GntR family transcriptional regulator [Streptomyces sp. LX-29]|uniref:GntR family transcriptional regulator n=1 Tax=Streptomyces sp. LX-29 TaxID=2900152 RepID=UPI00240DC584|nr:GntR family transcriptional regulator [Streptomyces sp. LX-29]WFB10685.1 GntR family transcriptional regulator [Streptomyces sp. LX-29]